MWRSRHIAEPIAGPVSLVMAVARDPLTMPGWAAGFATGIGRDAEGWLVDAPFGRVRVAFHVDVEAGILDHDVTMPDGSVVHNAMRVIPNDGGSEVVFSLFQREGMSDDEFEADAAAVAADLRRLRELCEKMAG